jgi:hypothetical protein
MLIGSGTGGTGSSFSKIAPLFAVAIHFGDPVVPLFKNPTM